MRLRRLGIGIVIVFACLAATLAMPVEVWRTGRLATPPLTLSAPAPVTMAARIWIDTDAACGYRPRTDVDDCLAIWLLATRRTPEVVGITTVFGNAPLDITHSTATELVDRLGANGGPVLPVYRGAAGALSTTSLPNEAVDALIDALETGPLTIVALGPVTNLALLLQARPDLAGRVQEVVAVMGRRAGHLFHPSEGSGRGSFLGHGPVFRDFNFASDPDAVRVLMQADLPVTLVPYDAARRVEITAADLEQLAARGAAGTWIAARSQGWLEYWQTDIGRRGFYPFDLMAAAYVLAPSLFRCADVRAWVGTDPLLFLPLFRAEALLVDRHTAGAQGRTASYCPAAGPAFEAQVHDWLSAPS